MSTLVLPPPSSTCTARCTSCGLEIITRRRTRLRRRSCPRCLHGRLQPPDNHLVQVVRQPKAPDELSRSSTMLPPPSGLE